MRRKKEEESAAGPVEGPAAFWVRGWGKKEVLPGRGDEVGEARSMAEWDRVLPGRGDGVREARSMAEWNRALPCAGTVSGLSLIHI